MEILALIIGNAALILPLFFWSRAERQADMEKVIAFQNLNNQFMIKIHNEINRFNQIFINKNRI